MKKIIAILFMFCLSAGFSQDKLNQFDDQGNRDGVWKGFHKNSNRIRYEGTFKHGKETGVFKYFDDTKASTIIATRDFSKNDNACYAIFYDQNGNKVSEGKLANKVNEGSWKYYHFRSTQLMTVEFTKMGNQKEIEKSIIKMEQLLKKLITKPELKKELRKPFQKKENQSKNIFIKTVSMKEQHHIMMVMAINYTKEFT